MCVDGKFIKPFKSYFVEDAVYSSINSMVVENKYWSGMRKKYFNKELVITKKDNKDFENSTKCWISDNGDFEVRDHCHVRDLISRLS